MSLPDRSHGLPLSLIALLAASALLRRPALQDAVRPGGEVGAELEQPAAYVLTAPLGNLLDTLSLLSLEQHMALLLTGLVGFGIWRASQRSGPRSAARRLLVEAGAGAAFLGASLTVYAAVALFPRPMAKLSVHDPDVVVVDFHSHTGFSHDTRSAVTVERRRTWHRAAGFDVAYISDHRNWAAMAQAGQDNPERAGDDVVLLSAVEVWFRGKHTNALGDSSRYATSFNERRRSFETDSLRRLVAAGAPEPTFILVLPEELDSLAPQGPEPRIGWTAIEISDGSPKGLEQSHRERGRLLALADSLDLATVAGTNNHGWGYTVAAWNLLSVPGWRDLSPNELAHRIEATLHGPHRDAVRVVERTMPRPRSLAELALTTPAVLWHMVAVLSGAERLAWLSYVVAAWVLVALARRRRRSAGPAPPSPARV